MALHLQHFEREVATFFCLRARVNQREVEEIQGTKSFAPLETTPLLLRIYARVMIVYFPKK